MKIIINKDKLTVEGELEINSGAIQYYEVDVEFDSSWDELTKKAVIVNDSENYGKDVSIINNKVCIEIGQAGNYSIGVVGFRISYRLTTDTEIEINKKYYTEQGVEITSPVLEDISTYFEQYISYRIPTNLQPIPNYKGASDEGIDIEEHTVPSVNEWEIYIAQIQSMLNNVHSIPEGGTTGQFLKKRSNSNFDTEWANGGGGGGGTTNHAELDNLSYENSGHTGFQASEVGKGLSTNDFTTEEKTKLESLENYDDTEVKSDIESLETNKADRTEIPTQLSDLSEDITHRTVTDSEKQIWNNKQNQLTAGTNITIQNNVISASLSNEEVILNEADDWEIGSIDSNGINANAIDKQRVIDYIDITEDIESITVEAEVGTTLRYRIFYYDENLNFTNFTGWLTSSTIDLTKKKARIMLDDSADTITASELYLHITITKRISQNVETPSKSILRKRLDNEILNIAYSKIGLAPINTREHFLTAAKIGFNALKTDIRVTSDNKLVSCHDAGFTFNENGRITTFNSSNFTPISSLTLDECVALEYEVSLNTFGHYPKVTSFEEFVKICKENNLIAYVTVRNGTDVNVTETLRVLDKYCMRYNTIINSFTPSSLQAFKDEDTDIIVSNVMTGNTVLTNANVDTVYSLGKDSIITMYSFAYGFNPWDTVVDDVTTQGTISQSSSAIEYAKSKGLLIYQAQISKHEDLYKCINLGFNGFQIASCVIPPKTSSYLFEVNMSNEIVTFGNILNSDVYTGTVEYSNNKIIISDIRLTGTERGFSDGVMELWLNQLPYKMIVKNSQGTVFNSTFTNNQIQINCPSNTTNEQFLITIELFSSGTDVNKTYVDNIVGSIDSLLEVI